MRNITAFFMPVVVHGSTENPFDEVHDDAVAATVVDAALTVGCGEDQQAEDKEGTEEVEEEEEATVSVSSFKRKRFSTSRPAKRMCLRDTLAVSDEGAEAAREPASISVSSFYGGKQTFDLKEFNSRRRGKKKKKKATAAGKRDKKLKTTPSPNVGDFAGIRPPGTVQLYLDAGQRSFSQRPCAECGMVYAPGQEEDEAVHSAFHKSWARVLCFKGWEEGELLGLWADGSKIFMIPAEQAPVRALKKLADVHALIDVQLGCAQASSARSATEKTLLLVSPAQRLVGAVVVEAIGEAYRVVAPTVKAPRDEVGLVSRSRVAVPALVGIRRVWITAKERRKGHASKLLEMARQHFSYGAVVSKDTMAFSQPTPMGKGLAEKYFERSDFLVYIPSSTKRALQ